MRPLRPTSGGFEVGAALGCVPRGDLCVHQVRVTCFLETAQNGGMK